MESERIFSKEEISKILSKASKIQAQKELYGEEHGLTVEELEHIAKEAGIDRNSLYEAIQNSDIPEFDSPFNWITASSHIQNIQIVSGEISKDTWEEIVQEIRRITGGIGKLNVVGKSFEWEQRLKEIGYKHISLTPENGTTKMQFVSNWGGLKLISTILPFIAGVAITSVLLDGTNFSDIVYLLLPLLGGTVALTAGRFYLKSYFKKQKKLFTQIAHSIRKKLDPSITSTILIEDSKGSNEISTHKRTSTKL